MNKSGLVAALILSGLTTPAVACSVLDWNNYEGFGQPPGVDVLARSVTVDWVLIEQPPPALCPRRPDAFLNPEAFEINNDPAEGIPPECDADFDNVTAPHVFATVIERLRGSSDQRFSMVRYIPPWRDDAGPQANWQPGYWRGFGDLRHSAAADAIAVSVGERSTAEGRHRDLAFWDGGHIGFRTDGSDSCGGEPTLDSEMRYIVFRDASGAVLALEPVLYQDDAFLLRLRDQTAPFDVTRYPIADFFRSGAALIEARVMSCEGDPGAFSRFDPAQLDVTRGDQASLERLFWSADGQPETSIRDFDALWDFYQTRGEACPVGESILLFSAEMAGPPIWSGGPEWAEARFPGWMGAVSAELDSNGEGNEMAPLEMVLGDPSGRAGIPRPIRVRDGRIRLAEIPTGLALEGPDWITVDQIFQWFEEGRAAATPAPSSS